MHDENVLKGKTLEGLLRLMFEAAQYEVRDFGVERQIPEVGRFSRTEYQELPVELRRLPDLLVYRWENEQPKVFFLEAKYRRELTSQTVFNLKSKLIEQSRYWQDIHCVLALGRSPATHNVSDYHQNYLRVFQCSEADSWTTDPETFWDCGKPIDEHFKEFSTMGLENPLTDSHGFRYVTRLGKILDAAVAHFKALA